MHNSTTTKWIKLIDLFQRNGFAKFTFHTIHCRTVLYNCQENYLFNIAPIQLSLNLKVFSNNLISDIHTYIVCPLSLE